MRTHARTYPQTHTHTHTCFRPFLNSAVIGSALVFPVCNTGLPSNWVTCMLPYLDNKGMYLLLFCAT